ncbi:ATP-binding protein [Streptomyces sp. NPDC058372]|uniref:ATP-binding protein n=1 Tax=Streptomyces sp. NPDC058372 TaxID=3346464 RepID=UPI003663CDA5
MDPNHRDPHQTGGGDPHRIPADPHQGPGDRRPRPPQGPDLGQPVPPRVRTVELVAGGHLVTVNPVDGSEIEACPPGRHPSPPVRRTPDDRAALAAAAKPPAPPGVPRTHHRLLERDSERDTLVSLLARGRSVRLTGPRGSGRTVLLDAVAARCESLAPDGVVRLDGHRRTADDLLHALCAAVHLLPAHRPGPALLAELTGEIGAVVLIDDAELGGAALDAFLAATPECAVLLACTPDVPPPGDESRVEEVPLGGIGRSGGLTLLAQGAGRALSDDEVSWAGDLWFESEGLPLRFVQAGALLHQRDLLREDADAADAPLPTVAEGAAPAALLASRLSEAARATLGFAYALGGEVPHQAHLPALVGDTHADASLTELLDCGLVTPVGNRYRLAAGVTEQLAAEGYADDGERAHTAAQHYTWWTGHPSVTPERAAAESDAVLAALTALVGGQDPVRQATAVLLARTVAPVLAAGLAWGAWERVLRSGQEAARLSGEVAEEAYFHHELGVLALCQDRLDRARAELEAAVALRGALADKRGTVAGRRALALVADRAGETVPVSRATPAPDAPPVIPRRDGTATPPAGLYRTAPPAGATRVQPAAPAAGATVVGGASAMAAKDGRPGRAALTGARRNLVAAGAGALLVAVLGTVVTLGAINGDDEEPASVDQVTTEQTTPEEEGDGVTEAEQPAGSAGPSTDPGEDGVTGTPDDPTPSDSASPSDTESEQPSNSPSDRPTTSPSEKPTTKSPSPPPSSSNPPSSPPPSSPDPEPSDPPPSSDDPDPEPPSEPGTDNSASGPAPEPSPSQIS